VIELCGLVGRGGRLLILRGVGDESDVIEGEEGEEKVSGEEVMEFSGGRTSETENL
jgi:hypothetical protein